MAAFFRPPFEETAFVEDGFFVNPKARLFGVADGVSAAYSPSHPPIKYEGLTGGQMATTVFSSFGELGHTFSSAQDFLSEVNATIQQEHRQKGLEPGIDDVGGAAFVVCQITADKITFVLGGDCFGLYRDSRGLNFLSALNEKSFETEREADRILGECLRKAGKKQGWDDYHPIYRARRIRCANKLIAQGGYAELNGDPALLKCWTVMEFDLTVHSPKFILIGSDGLIPAQTFDPACKNEMGEKLGEIYERGGLQAVLEWRDETEHSLHHITGWPEGSAVEIKFG